MGTTIEQIQVSAASLRTVSFSFVAGAIYEVTANSNDGKITQALVGVDSNGSVNSVEMTAGGGCYSLIASGGSLVIDNFDSQARTIDMLVCNLADSGVSSINNSDLPMIINEPLFAAAFASAIRTRPGVAISLLPYLINPTGTGVLVATDFQNVDATQVVIDQASRSITVNKDPEQGDYTFNLMVAQ